MTWRSHTGLLLAICLLAMATSQTSHLALGGESASKGPSIEYMPLDAPAGTSRAVIVQGHALVHTRQLMALDPQDKLVGKGHVGQQVEQVLDNLERVLEESDSSLDQLVRVNVYAMTPGGVDLVREKLSERLPSSVRPALTGVLTPLPHRDALVALDAVAVAVDQGPGVAFHQCGPGSDQPCADAAVLPRGGVVYLSGMPAEAGLTESAVDASMEGLWKELDELSLTPDQIVHIKVFLRPAWSAEAVLKKLNEWFPGKTTPPVTFVEWLAPPPVEIELVVQLPQSDDSKPNVEYYNPPYVRPLQIFSKVAIVNTDRQIYLGGLFPSKEGGGDQAAALDVFDQLSKILAATGSDMLHMVKGTYYVTDDGSARGTDRARLWLYPQDRPPAASKCMVHGVGMDGRKMTLDMIAVSAE